MQQAVEGHPDVAAARRAPATATARLLAESQRGRVAPGFEGMRQDAVHQGGRQAGGERQRRVAVDTAKGKLTGEFRLGASWTVPRQIQQRALWFHTIHLSFHDPMPSIFFK